MEQTPTFQGSRRLSSFHLVANARAPLRSLDPNKNAQTPQQPSPTTAANKHATPAPSARRQSRRVSRAASRRITRRVSRNNHLSQSEISEMYSTTIKLCQDNKINARNTWNLDLIDYLSVLVNPDRPSSASDASALEPGVEGGLMSQALQRAGSSEDTDFKLAGVTLDAGVKIYCSRVDSVHTNAFKVLGGLSGPRGVNDNGSGEDGGNADSDAASSDESPEGGSKSGRQVRRTGRATLESNLANITAQKLETDLAADPLFHKMSAAFDEGGARGMLVNNLSVAPAGHLVFDSAEPADTFVLRPQAEETSDAQETYDVSTLLPTQSDEPPTICPAFLRFFRARIAPSGSTTSELEQAPTDSQISSWPAPSQDAYNPPDMPPSTDFEYESTDLAEAGEFSIGPVHASNDDLVSTVDDEDDVTLPVGSSSEMSALTARSGGLDLVEAGVALGDSEYDFFSRAALAAWAGPTHWRFRGGGAKPVNKATEKRPRGRTARLLDFSDSAPAIDFSREFAAGRSRSANMLSARMREGADERKTTLPEDLHLGERWLCGLFLKPGTSVRVGRADATVPGREGADAGSNEVGTENREWYNFDNDGDVGGFEDDVAHGFGDEDVNDDMSGTPAVGGVELVDEPTRVEAIDINYAKVARKVDVRLLKKGLWSRLCGEDATEASIQTKCSTAVSEEVAESDEEAKPATSQAEDVREGGQQKMTEIVSKIGGFVPKASMQDVSVPYVFICLLHLANEKTLKIEQGESGSMSELVIRHDE